MNIGYWKPSVKTTCSAREEQMKRILVGVEPVSPCNCIGPQGGQPLCPCQMRFVKVIDGRYVKTTDLGPAP